MKILILYTYNQGLLSNFFQELSEKLYHDGYEVINFYLKHREDYFLQNGVRIYGEKKRGYFKNYYRIYTFIKKEKPDVVISNFSYINPAVLAGRLLGVKSNIAWFHTAYGHTKPSFIKVYNKTLYLNMANLVLANSKNLQKEMHTVYKVPRNRTKRVPFWTNITNYEPCTKTLNNLQKTGAFKIGCPGRLVSDKNHQIVIEAVNALKTNKPIELFIAGNGAYKQDLETLVEDLNLKNQVIFLGNLSLTEMVAFYKSMDVVVLPSYHEAFGLVFIEAIALGTPVIVSSKFGALDFIDTQEFLLETFTFNPNSVSELINHLQSYINKNGMPSNYFKDLYTKTFDKELIYQTIKDIVTNPKTLN
ncbi:glycosyltransferase family 4 protein [Oceanihabitans sp. 2_MG-2023]|uniref:glycosyltransferase family 4 protein n=1 Tax=Oceanihabitans sp. 2_MG-2023 TaxID=3062661 RepID=UPI0026E2D741|nr:glycosyltransferase family 4 protein [Oceanihabitans sp. 2_MG-2023]MDO6597698.1 glycosyltransferase family 4 protein [Oceanihabitans sp. 2_MG-2023]